MWALRAIGRAHCRATDQSDWIGFGSLAGFVAFLVYLTNISRRVPSKVVIDLLGPEDDADES
jgi:hypothetical protein